MEEPVHIPHGRPFGWMTELPNVTYLVDVNSTAFKESSSTPPLDSNYIPNLNSTVSANLTDPTTPKNYVHPMLFIVCASFLILFCLVSLIVNVVILFSVCFIRSRILPNLYISLSLAGADTLSLFFFALGLILFTLLDKLGVKINAPCILLLIEALRMGAILTTMFHLAALAVNHYLGILKPLHSHVYLTRRNIQYCMIVLWTLPSSLMVLEIFYVEIDGFNTCPHSFLMKEKFRLRFSLLFFITLAGMTVIYTHIYILVSRLQRDPLSISRRKERGRKSGYSKDNEKAVITTMMFVGSTIFGWLPAFTYFALFCTDCVFSEYFNLRTNTEFAAIFTINFLMISKTATNCYIYVFRIKEIKVALRRMLRRVMLCLCGYTPPLASGDLTLTRTLSRGSTSRSRTCVYRMTSHNEVNGTVRIPSRNTQFNTSV